jgi:HD superfamily phosphohydrolase
MHLAGKFARHWYSNYLAVKAAQHQEVAELPSVNFVEEVFRIAGLLHDIGHGPFSHTLDSAYKTYYQRMKATSLPPNQARLASKGLIEQADRGKILLIQWEDRPSRGRPQVGMYHTFKGLNAASGR